MSSVTITIVYDNRTINRSLKRGFGFSCVINFGHRKILFDTGGDKEAFFTNMKKLGIDLKTISHVVFSHKHWDHTTGFSEILGRLRDHSFLYLPSDFNQKLEAEIPPHITVHKITKFEEIDHNIFSLVLRGRYCCIKMVQEQALVLRIPKGLIVLTGCAHPGIDRIARNAQEHLGEKIYLVLGGFHLCHSFKCTCAKMVKAIRELKVEKVAPCHCTGESAIKLFQREYGDNFIPIGSGFTATL